MFNAAEFVRPRLSETFRSLPAPADIANAIEQTVHRVEALLPAFVHAEAMTIYLESSGSVVYPDGTIEMTPLSIITGMQSPKNNVIRLGIWEIQNDELALRSILAHEMGHMLVEWASRQAGTIPADQDLFRNWDASIYEGVAEFISAVTTGSTIIGCDTCWFHRDIFKYQTIDEARQDHLTLEMLEAQMNSNGWAARYPVYGDFLKFLKDWFQDPTHVDQYAAGDWLAMKLWQASDSGKTPKDIIRRILEVAQTRVHIDSPEDFLATVLP